MSGRPAARIYFPCPIAAGGRIELSPDQAHRLRSVLRLGAGAAIAVFNRDDGEWVCRIDELGKSRARATVQSRLRLPELEPDLWLLFAPIKRARLDWLVEKATELGASVLMPVWTARTQVERLNIERLQAHAISAAAQSERLSVPELRAPEPLDAVLACWPPGRSLIVCDETGVSAPIGEALAQLSAEPAALLVGPEGGFNQSELDALDKLSFVSRVGLGPRVLRAETAAVAALALFQGIAGDWRQSRSR
ncbi:MAG: 16S rRNA (uracil(1498)-N(3))-methyltransferase [Alphaproteobacteria bacterium]|nr:16S rRNA (uracil(1498)-N(3))-methyltransferase [Alphaproteobacteria bacterium]